MSSIENQQKIGMLVHEYKFCRAFASYELLLKWKFVKLISDQLRKDGLLLYKLLKIESVDGVKANMDFVHPFFPHISIGLLRGMVPVVKTGELRVSINLKDLNL